MGSVNNGDRDARDALAWIESGMPDEKVGHGPDHADEDPAEPGHWLCSECGLSRWWRASFLRGDASVGWVSKGYNVTA